MVDYTSKIFRILFFTLAISSVCVTAKLSLDLESNFDKTLNLFNNILNNIDLSSSSKKSLDNNFAGALVSKKEPEILLDKIRENLTFQIDSHSVQTEDGYILTAWHLTKKCSTEFLKSKPNGTRVVMLQHGLLDDSYTWLALKDNSLANLLLEEGYDVWLTNSRGNIFSKQHVDPSHDRSKERSPFWNFSFDEMAEFDLVANINFILNFTKREKLIYIGHSQGTLQYYLQYTTNPEFLNQKVEKYVSIGTVFTLFTSVSYKKIN